MLKPKARSVGVCALFFLFLPFFPPLCLPLLLSCSAVWGGCGWLFSWPARLQTFAATHLFKPACNVTLLPDGRTLHRRLLQSITPDHHYSRTSWCFLVEVSWVSDRLFHGLRWNFTYSNPLTSFQNCWAFIFVYLCVWDPITNPFFTCPLIRQDIISGVFYFSASCQVHCPSEAFRIANLHETSSVSQNQPVLKVSTPSFAQLHEVTRVLVPCLRTFHSL